MVEKRTVVEGLTLSAFIIAFLLSTLSPYLGYPASSTELQLGLATLLMVFTLGIVAMENPDLFEELRIGAGGLTLRRRLGEQLRVAIDIKEKETPPEIKEEVQEIKREANEDPAVAFLALTSRIERRLDSIYQFFYTDDQRRHIPVGKIIADLETRGVISNELGGLIRDFRGMRNRIIHYKFTKKDLEIATSIGEVVITKLEETYNSLDRKGKNNSSSTRVTCR